MTKPHVKSDGGGTHDSPTAAGRVAAGALLLLLAALACAPAYASKHTMDAGAIRRDRTEWLAERRTSYKGTSCDTRFERSERWLVYAKYVEEITAGRGA